MLKGVGEFFAGLVTLERNDGPMLWPFNFAPNRQAKPRSMFMSVAESGTKDRDGDRDGQLRSRARETPSAARRIARPAFLTSSLLSYEIFEATSGPYPCRTPCSSALQRREEQKARQLPLNIALRNYFAAKIPLG
jgi:hypothetical protein